MKDQNHKISRQIVDTAIQENVSIIKLERLENIRKTARTSRKNAKNRIVGFLLSASNNPSPTKQT
ncbi:hypothetical protein P7H19_07190 [Paenibacillus larvae]|nr:hypothetical protein [Paenibacillus larvae]MDT2236128.1 hypothetical protein [Paenibacillus larvae]